jgi:diguanylate cyclase (GGDEF)-like protein
MPTHLIVLTHTTGPNAWRVIERIRKELEETQFVFRGRRLRVTASFGIAGFERRQAPDFGDLVVQADRALYSAKRQGRNRIEMAPALQDPRMGEWLCKTPTKIP